MKSEIKAWRAAKRLQVSVKFLHKLRVAGVLAARRYAAQGDWLFNRGQVESLRTTHVGEYGSEDVAAAAGVSERRIRQMVSCGTLPDRRFVTPDGRRMGKLRFRAEDMERVTVGRENGLRLALKGEMLD